MVPQAINSNTSQIDARVNYSMEKLRLSVAYYGSFFQNNNATLNPSVPGSLNNPLGQLLPLSAGLQSILNLPVAQEPDNRFQPVVADGHLRPGRKDPGILQVVLRQRHAEPELRCLGADRRAGRGDPAGWQCQFDTGLAGHHLAANPKLTLQADVRYANRDDKTPVAPYVMAGSAVYTNQQLPEQKVSGKLQAIYQFSREYRGTIGADYVGIDRGIYTSTSSRGGISALRQNTDETGLYAELHKVMSETFTGSIRLSGSQRDGSNWLKPNPGAGVTEVSDPSTAFSSSAIFSPTLADRRQEKIKIFGNWQPDEKLALQFTAEGGTNKYTLPTAYALQNTRLSLYSVDGTYAISDNWNLTAYASWGQQTQNQARPAGSVMAFETTNTAAGVGVTGKPTGKLEVGGTLSYVNEKSAVCPVAGNLCRCRQRGPAGRHRRLAEHHFPPNGAETVRKIRPGQEQRHRRQPDLCPRAVERLGLGLERNALHLWRQHHDEPQPEPVHDLPRGDLHLQVLTPKPSDAKRPEASQGVGPFF
jgi:MtrB/PioB family decaheme-associated outer membrane protein